MQSHLIERPLKRVLRNRNTFRATPRSPAPGRASARAGPDTPACHGPLNRTWTSAENLRTSAPLWWAYLQAVYHGSFAPEYPFTLASLGFFYAHMLPAEARAELPETLVHACTRIGDCGCFEPLRESKGSCKAATPLHEAGSGTVVELRPGTGLLWRYTGWRPGGACPEPLHPSVWRHGGTAALPSGTRVEVMHWGGEDGFLTGSGMWYYVSVGAGVYIDLGRTRAFADHATALQSLEADVVSAQRGGEARVVRLAECQRLLWVDPEERVAASGRPEYASCGCGGGGCHNRAHLRAAAMTWAARSLGYDTLQFVALKEYGLQRSEILDVRTVYDRDVSPRGERGLPVEAWEGRGACYPFHAERHFFRGWGGTEPCNCTAAVAPRRTTTPQRAPSKHSDPALKSRAHVNCGGMPALT